MDDRLSITGTKSRKKLYESFISLLRFTKLNELVYNTTVYHIFKKLSIIRDKLIHSGLSLNVVIGLSLHSLHEKQINPLRGIHLVNLIATNCVFEELVGIRADLSDCIFLLDKIKIMSFCCKWIVEDLNYQLNKVKLSYNFLSLVDSLS